MRINRKIESVAASAEAVFTKLNDFQQYATKFSGNIQDWRTTEDGCTFTVNKLATCTLHILEQTPFSKIKYQLDTDKSMSAIADVFITDRGTICDIDIEITANVPIFMEPMIKMMMERNIDSIKSTITNSLEKS